jgi:hypothetical protein
MSINKSCWIVDDQGVRHKPFTPVEISARRQAHLAHIRHIYEVSDLTQRIEREWPAATVRQLARNMGLAAPETDTELRKKLLGIVAGGTSSEVKIVLTPAPAEPEPPEAPALPEPSAPEPLVPPEHIAPEAWERLLAAWDAQDYKAARSALASLSDDPTPSKATELWEAVEALLRDHGMLK